MQFINKVLKNVGCFLMIRAFLFKTLFQLVILHCKIIGSWEIVTHIITTGAQT